MPAPEVRGPMRVRPLLRAAGLTLCCALLWSACGKKDTATPEQPPPPPGMPRIRPTPTAIQPPVGSRPEPTASSDTYPTPSSARFDMPPERPSNQGMVPSAQVDEVTKVRDYGAELSALMKLRAPSCLAGWDPSGKTSISIQVTAQVMGSGAISRAEVQGAGLSPTMVACMQKQAGALQLIGPIEAAPRSVSTTMTLETAGSGTLQPRAAAQDLANDRDENPRDSKLQDVANDPPEVMQKDEPVREPPEAPEPRELPPNDDTSADQQP